MAILLIPMRVRRPLSSQSNPCCYLTSWASSSCFQVNFFTAKMRVMDLFTWRKCWGRWDARRALHRCGLHSFPDNQVFIVLLSEESNASVRGRQVSFLPVLQQAVLESLHGSHAVDLSDWCVREKGTRSYTQWKNPGVIVICTLNNYIWFMESSTENLLSLRNATPPWLSLTHLWVGWVLELSLKYFCWNKNSQDWFQRRGKYDLSCLKVEYLIFSDLCHIST